MSELISREDALKWCHEDEWHTPDERWRPESEYGEYIKALPTVDTDLSAYSDRLWREAYERGKAEGEPEPSDVARDISRIIENEIDMRVIAQPERKGKWILHQDSKTWQCSKCEKYQIMWSNFCPNCGADMRGE